MKKRNIIFRDNEIVEFCRITEDTNEIHNPEFMNSIGKRLIVPGMFVLGMAINLADDFLKNHADMIKVFFNTLLSAGDIATIVAAKDPDHPDEIRLSAINHKDTLNSRQEYSSILYLGKPFQVQEGGILRRLNVNPDRIEKFRNLIHASDPDVAHFLFAIAFASHALLNCIDDARTDVEKEINNLISSESKISPFYKSLEIHIPQPFPSFELRDSLDYYIHFDCEKPHKLYTAYVRCEHDGKIIFQSTYKMVGIPDLIILRMAKAIHSFHRGTSLC
ncbi:MAG: MaoC family dehydratase [Bacteroidota bacterium]|nr:MaoC family dehydratase [Bacteroidota bacterium]